MLAKDVSAVTTLFAVITTLRPVTTNRLEANYVCSNGAKCSNSVEIDIDISSQNVVIFTKRVRI